MRLALVMVPALALTGCLFEDGPELIYMSGETMGTTFNVTVIDPPDGTTKDALLEQIETVLSDVNAKMSNWDPESEVSLFNANTSTDPIQISSDFEYVMQGADTVHTLSDGKFDVTLAPLINLWGFGPKKPGEPVPTETEIRDALTLVGQSSKLTLSDTSLQKSDPAVSVNLSAIAKGYGVDRIAESLQEAGITRYLVDIGGDLVANGNNIEDVPWTIGIERPDAGVGTVQQVVALGSAGLATSGDYRNFFEEDGVRYSHIIDPTTGRPITHNTASVTVIARNAMLADALATAFLVLGKEASIPIADAQDLPVFFIDRTGDTFATSATSAFQELMRDTQ